MTCGLFNQNTHHGCALVPCYQRAHLVRLQTSGGLLSATASPLARPLRPLGLLVRLSPVAANVAAMIASYGEASLAGRQTSDAFTVLQSNRLSTVLFAAGFVDCAAYSRTTITRPWRNRETLAPPGFQVAARGSIHSRPLGAQLPIPSLPLCRKFGFAIPAGRASLSMIGI